MKSMHRLYLCYLVVLPACGFAQDAEIAHLYIPTNNCQRCHEVPGVRDASAGITDRVRMSEWMIWQQQDKHASAYQVLLEPRSQRIGKLLGKDVLDAGAGCIQCHTSNAVIEQWSPACYVNGENPYIAEGVSCQTCHGPAELWEAEHIKPGWRQKSLQEKAAFGFKVMENPIERADMCTSCHVGSAELGRVITHEMYAAGHPMLSGFEMEAFADKMPRHWRYTHEKPGAPPFNYERTRAVLVGSIVALRNSLQLASDSGKYWPELARFECYSCHHELRFPSWRQEGHAERFAGRPRLESGCLPLVRATTEIAEGSAESFDLLIARTREPFAVNPFGDPAQVAAIGNVANTWSTEITERLNKMPLNEAQVRSTLAKLLAVAAEGTHDFDTARQLTGAIYVVGEELSRSGAQVPGLDRLLVRLKTLEDDERGFALVSTTDKRVEDKYHLQLANRARFKPAAYAALMKSLNEEVDLGEH
jgi:hypothetical protein